MTKPLQATLDALTVTAVLLVLWQLAYQFVGANALTDPYETFVAAARLLVSPAFGQHLLYTAKGLAVSFGIAVLVGVPVGLALGVLRFSGDVAEPLLASLYTIPKVTLYPIVLAVFGLGLSAKVAFGVMHAIIPMMLIIMGAVRAIKPVYLKTSRTLRLSAWQTASRILLPSVLPDVVTALRVGFSLSLLGVLVGEMFSSQQGIGFLLIKGITSSDVKTSIAITLMIVIFGVATGAMLLGIDRRFHHRQSPQR